MNPVIAAAQTLTRLMPTLTAMEMANYLDRVKLYGEAEALTWLQARHENR